MIAESSLPEFISIDSPDLLHNREIATQLIKDNLLKAQERMKHFADKKRKEREFKVGDMAYLKIQPYRHTSLSIHRYMKLHSNFYGPFRVLEKIGNNSDKLLLLEGCKLHPTFHVSQLKQHIRHDVVPTPTFHWWMIKAISEWNLKLHLMENSFPGHMVISASL